MRIGFIGLGIMGEAMCYNIIRKHDGDVYIYDVKTEPVQRLAEKGGIACDSVVDAAKHSDVIITMLPRSEDSLSVYKEILPAVNATKICIDMSTIDPSVSLKISVMIQAHGGHFLDAPVVKSKAAAGLGNIGIYVGGEKEIYFQVKPILQYMGSNVLYMGSSGKGIGMKICQTTLLAQIQNGVNEALAMAVKQGIDVDRFTAALSFGGGQNAYFDKDGFVVETSTEVIDGVPKITGISCEEVVLYEKLQLENSDILRDLLNLTQTLKKYNLLPDEIQYDSNMEPVLYYGTIQVKIGSEDNLSQKVVRLSIILPQLDGLSGTLHLETWTPETTDIIWDRAEEQSETEEETTEEPSEEPSADTPAEEQPAQDVPAENTPAEEQQPAENAPAEDMPPVEQ